MTPSLVPGTTPCHHTTNARSALHHTTSRADNGDDMSDDDDGNDDDDGGDESRKVGDLSHLPHARGRTGGRAGGRAGGRTDGRAGDDARTGGRTSGASMGRAYGRSCVCVDVRGRAFRVVPPRDARAPPRRTHIGIYRQAGVLRRRSTRTTRAGD